MTLVLFPFHFIIFVLGLIIGSFLNCVIYRIEREQSFVKGRSYCPHCKHNLAWVDLIPVASFLLLKARCRYCQKKISWQYPIVEIVTGFLFLLIFNFRFPALDQTLTFSLQNVLELCFMVYILCSMIVIFVYDLKHFLIPDKILFPAIAVTVMYQIVFHFHFFMFNSLWAGLAASLFFTAIFFLSNGEWMGFGDCKLAILLGLLLGFPGILLGLFLAFLLGAVFGIISMLLHKKGLKSEIPFAPFLILGTFIAMLWGQQIIDWYIGLLTF